jgi:1-acyl-sn-glycerol-3-phosphate acyltransferase
MLYLFIRFVTLFLCRILFRLEVFGQNNIPLEGGFILASNHASYLDPPLLGVACPRILYFLANKELFKNIFFARFISSLNAFPIDTQTGDLKTLRWAIRELKAGKPLAIFPEGRRTFDGELEKPKLGVGFLAIKAGVCIVPTFIKGSKEALPREGKFIRLKKIAVYFGPPIKIEEFSKQLSNTELYQAIAEKVMAQISRLKAKFS